MKKVGWLILAVLVVLAALGPALGVTVRPLSEQEKAETGANLKVVVTHADLTNATANTAQTLTLFNVAAKQGVECVAEVLPTAFYDGATNGFNTTTVTVGDGTGATLFLSSTELNVYGTEVFLKYGRLTFDGAATATFVTGVTPSTTNLVIAVSPTIKSIGGTNYVSASTLKTVSVERATSTATASALIATGVGKKLYTTTDTVDAVFTPMSGYSLADLDYGEVWFYFNVWDAAKRK